MIPHSIFYSLPLHTVCVEESAVPLTPSWDVTYVLSGRVAARCVSRKPVRRDHTDRWEYPLKTGRPKSTPEAPQYCFAVTSDALHGNVEQYRNLTETIASQFAESTEMSGGRERLKAHFYSPRRGLVDALCLVCHGYHNDTSSEGPGLLLAPPVGYIGHWIRLPPIGNCHVVDLPFDFFPRQVKTHSGFPGDIITVEDRGSTARKMQNSYPSSAAQRLRTLSAQGASS
jgi:hypothetical protein